MIEDLLPGGRGDDLTADDVDARELAMGIEHELEHTGSRKLAKEIALDHLAEDPHYYSNLKKAGLEARRRPLMNARNLIESRLRGAPARKLVASVTEAGKKATAAELDALAKRFGGSRSKYGRSGRLVWAFAEPSKAGLFAGEVKALLGVWGAGAGYAISSGKNNATGEYTADVSTTLVSESRIREADDDDWQADEEKKFEDKLKATVARAAAATGWMRGPTALARLDKKATACHGSNVTDAFKALKAKLIRRPSYNWVFGFSHWDTAKNFLNTVYRDFLFQGAEDATKRDGLEDAAEELTKVRDRSDLVLWRKKLGFEPQFLVAFSSKLQILDRDWSADVRARNILWREPS